MADVASYYAELLSGDFDSVIRLFVEEPELHHPERGRVRGIAPLKAFLADQHRWLTGQKAAVKPVHLVVTPERTVEELVLRHVLGDATFFESLRQYRATRELGENLRRFLARHSNTELRQFLAGESVEPVERDRPAAPVPQGVEG